MTTHIVLPARLDSSRLPHKPVLPIGNIPLIARAYKNAVAAAGDRDVIVATDANEIAELVPRAWLSHADCNCGTDRCAEVARSLDWDDDDLVINVQPDMPFLAKKELSGFITKAEKGGDWDILSAYCNVETVEYIDGSFERLSLVQHIGIYAMKCAKLREFAKMPQSASELALHLEQMRAVDAGWKFGFYEFDIMPMEVNTPADLMAADAIARMAA